MRILITGGLGHLGSAILHSKLFNNPIVVDNLSTRRYCSLFNAPPFRFFQRDIFDNLADLPSPQVVVHLAGVINAAEIERDPSTARFINVYGVDKLVRDCQKWKARLIFASSTSVYHGCQGEVDEQSNIEPVPHYAKQKLEAERIIEASGLDYAILRLGTVFGWSAGMRFDTVVQKFCWQVFTGQPITIWRENEHKVRPYLGLDDFLQALELVVNKELRGTFNVVSHHFTPRQVVDTIKSLGLELQVRLITDPIMAQESYLVKTDKIREAGFEPLTNLGDDIESIMKMLGKV